MAIAITTRNRHDALARTLKELDAGTPPEFPIIIVDDASDKPVDPGSQSPRVILLHRFEENVGIPRAKNKCLELLMSTGAEHLFLLDDDCYPAIENWWKPYVYGPESHYNYIFTHWTNGTAVGDCAEIYNDGRTRAFDQARGCAIYLHRSVVEKVGGFDPVFGLGMEEHLEYSRRICNAGLTTFPFQDVVGSDELWYSTDRAQAGTRTLPRATRETLLARNRPLAEERRDSKGYVEYRELPNVVITQLLTKSIDGQRGTQWPRDADLVKDWATSIRGARSVVLLDQSVGSDSESGWRDSVVWIVNESGWHNPYLERWRITLKYLRQTQAKWVWITDGTDVEMLHEPWGHMSEGLLYVGYEPCTVAKPWLAQHHPFYKSWIGPNVHREMLNCGVIGGDRDTVLEFLGDMVRELARACHGIEYEMGSFNYLLRQPRWMQRWITGPQVVTMFKADERNDFSWWKHK